ncbi:MAG: signal recognition particle-docking protein FtsY [Candidatus Pacearchaeota archaeon]
MFNLLKKKLGDWTKKISSKGTELELEKTKEKNKTPEKEEVNKEFSKKIIKVSPKEEEVKGVLSRVSARLSKVKISEKEFGVYAEELEMLLLENNVALEVAEEIIKKLKSEVIEKEFLKKEVESEIKDILREIIKEILVPPFLVLEKIEENKKNSEDPYVILFCGINGVGKTTVIAKIASQLKEKGISSVIAAADTFRAASIEQIKTHGEKLKIKVIAHEYGSDPAAVGFDAVKYAKKNKIDCVLIDTAGRIHTAKNLLNEIEKISRVCKPNLKLFIGESITGNDAIEQAKSFNWSIGVDGIVLTKADIDEKGGTALSVSYVTKKPILYLGTGQEYDKIEPFDRDKFIEKLGL